MYALMQSTFGRGEQLLWALSKGERYFTLKNDFNWKKVDFYFIWQILL
jgi:hypothetical protein